jgi:hypothetical protein
VQGDQAGDSPERPRQRGGYHLNNAHAAVELFMRLNHARQTLDFVKRQVGLGDEAGGGGAPVAIFPLQCV